MSTTPLASRRDFVLTAGCYAAIHGVASRLAVGAVAPQDEGEGDAITAETIAYAEKVAGIAFTEDERKVIAESVGEQLGWYAQRAELGELPNGLAPACVFRPLPPGRRPNLATAQGDARVLPEGGPPLPADERDIAFAPIAHLAHWIRSKAMTSEQLTRLYLKRLKRADERLHCVITLTEPLALEQARRADEEIAAGRDRGPLHGIPWGAKDILDTAGIATTFGAAPYRDRVPDSDAAVVRLLDEAGAVLLAKLSVGALAYGDLWFGERTRNPFDPAVGSSGSSAGPAAATAAGCVAFSVGSETCGSIISPCMVCGTTGLRPTFGRVPRTGAMALCWSLDKLGPICRTVDDCSIVLAVLSGQDDGDAASVSMPYFDDRAAGATGLRVGYDPRWFEGRRVNDLDREALQLCGEIGCEMVELEWPRWPYGILFASLAVEAAAAFEVLTRSGRDDELTWQEPQAWPNSFRTSWFIPAVEHVQIERFRRQCVEMIERQMQSVDALIAPSYAGGLLMTTNATGHPSLTLRTGFNDPKDPHGITLIGRLFDEGTLCRIGRALERALDVWHVRPAE